MSSPGRCHHELINYYFISLKSPAATNTDESEIYKLTTIINNKLLAKNINNKLYRIVINFQKMELTIMFFAGDYNVFIGHNYEIKISIAWRYIIVRTWTISM